MKQIFLFFKLGPAYGKMVTWMIFIFGAPLPFPKGHRIQDLWLFFPLPKLSSSLPKPGGVSTIGINWSYYWPATDVLPGESQMDLWVTWAHVYVSTCSILMSESGGDNHCYPWVSYLQGTLMLW